MPELWIEESAADAARQVLIRADGQAKVVLVAEADFDVFRREGDRWQWMWCELSLEDAFEYCRGHFKRPEGGDE